VGVIRYKEPDFCSGSGREIPHAAAALCRYKQFFSKDSSRSKQLSFFFVVVAHF
jgi:hypothetical protein